MKINKLIIISKEACDCVKHRCQLLRLVSMIDEEYGVLAWSLKYSDKSLSQCHFVRHRCLDRTVASALRRRQLSLETQEQGRR
jgi:hypothetical protein